MSMQIEFSGKHAWDINRDSMSFEVIVDGNKTRCLISHEALEDHFGADQTQSPEQAFKNNQYAIENVARKIIGKGLVDPNGEYLIRSQDV
jgi:hypothetical protein